MKLTTLLATGAALGAYRAGYLPALTIGVTLVTLYLFVRKPGTITRGRINRLNETIADLDLKRQRIEHALDELRESGDASQSEIATHEGRLDRHDRLVARLEARRAKLEASLDPLRRAAASAGWPDVLF